MILTSDVATVKEVAGYLKCSLTTVYEMCENGRLRWFKLKPGSRKGIRIMTESVRAMMSQPQVEPEPVRPRLKSAQVKPGKSILQFRD
jgi:excisionase family DNA binding protein